GLPEGLTAEQIRTDLTSFIEAGGDFAALERAYQAVLEVRKKANYYFDTSVLDTIAQVLEEHRARSDVTDNGNANPSSLQSLPLIKSVVRVLFFKNIALFVQMFFLFSMMLSSSVFAENSPDEKNWAALIFFVAVIVLYRFFAYAFNQIS
ncbi:MAG: hypothetical protein KC713_03260, partial [Candidatus Omnitrophica bacterium]|nr:hypothetical protein [Candidatus Omnitrophota bacterium]